MKTVLESLMSYFENTSPEQIERDWSESKKYDTVGPKIDEFINQSKFFHEIKIQNSYWEYICENEILINPKFALDFFYILVKNLK